MKITKTLIANKLKSAGWRIKFGENTSGANKYWLVDGKKGEAKIILKNLGAKQIPNYSNDFRGNGWYAEFQGREDHNLLFVEVFTKSKAGKLHSIGYDN